MKPTTAKICLRCDWQGETSERACPDCGEQPLYVAAAPVAEQAGMPVGDRPRTAPSVPAAPSGSSSIEPSPAAAEAEAAEHIGRRTHPALPIGLAGLLLIVILGAGLRPYEDRPAQGSSSEAAVSETPASPVPTDPSPSPGTSTESEPPSAKTVSRIVAGVPFSLRVPTTGWEEHHSISINKSTMGPQGAEAIMFWTSFHDPGNAYPCARVLGSSDDLSAARLAAAVATAPGTELAGGPADVNVGGRPAVHVTLVVRERVGCDPGFFYTWQPQMGGALWTETNVGDTIRVWIVDVGGTHLFFEVETTTRAGPGLEQEIRQIVRSIRFD